MITEQTAIEIINHVFGIDYSNEKYPINTKRLDNTIKSRGVDLNEVIYSLYDDGKGSIWVIAANKYYSQRDCRELISYIIEFDLYEEYFLS